MPVSLQKKVDQAAREIAARIAGLKEEDATSVLDAFKAQAASKQVLSAAFWLLDGEPRWFPDHQTWHPRLRNVRNHPVIGKQLFELWQ